MHKYISCSCSFSTKKRKLEVETHVQDQEIILFFFVSGVCEIRAGLGLVVQVMQQLLQVSFKPSWCFKEFVMLAPVVCSYVASFSAGSTAQGFQKDKTYYVLHNMEKRNINKFCTHAEVVCTSCQLLLKFCFSSFIKLTPSFCLISTRCFSLAANTCRKVEISSSS